MKQLFLKILQYTVICTLIYCHLSPAQTESVKDKLKGYDEYVEEILKEWKVPGAAVAVVKDGQIVLAKGYGFRDLENKLKVNSKTLFGVGSITKTFAATSIGILQDEKKVHIDTPIINYIPDFRLYDECMTKQVTLRDMLSHRSGLSGMYWLLFPVSREKMFKDLQFEKPTRELRESFQYNNYNYTVCSHILERITGIRWEDFVREKIFIPLDMNQSCFTYNKAKLIENHSLPYLEIRDGVKLNDIDDDSIWGAPGQMFSNVEDISNWMIAFLNSGIYKGKRIISENYVMEMAKPNISHSLNPRFDELFGAYGLGLNITSYQGEKIVYHVGAYDGFISHLIMQPETKTGIIVLTNMADPRIVSALSFRALECLLGLNKLDWKTKIREITKERMAQLEKEKNDNLKNKKLNSKTSFTIKSYTGKFYNDIYGYMELFADRDTLKVKYNKILSTLILYNDDVFETDKDLWNAKISFRISSGKVDGLFVDHNPAVEKILFKKVN